MKRNMAIRAIIAACAGKAGFGADAVGLASNITDRSPKILTELLLECGVIPEQFGHDSSQEKLYAKYCDIILKLAFDAIGIPSQVIDKRGGSADVEGQTDTYSIVGDAKAFRLSRTAKNQKDFKIEALSQWRGNKDYACLVCPLYHYPNTASAIYSQAATYKVVLLGYVHLAFLVWHSQTKKHDLEAIWQISQAMTPSKKAKTYWDEADAAVVVAVGETYDSLEKLKKTEATILEEMKKEELKYWEKETEKIYKLSHEQAVRQLRESMKIDEKIRQILSVSY